MNLTLPLVRNARLRSSVFFALICATALVHAAPGDTELLSVAPNGKAAGFTFVSAISADGRYVVLNSSAPVYLPGATNPVSNVFVRDRQSGTIELVSVNSAGMHDPVGCEPDASISADGRYVAFVCWSGLVPGDTNGLLDVYVRDRQAGTTQRVNLTPTGAQGNGSSIQPAISADGRYVAFTSISSNLVAGDTNDRLDVFVRDRQAGSTQRVSVSPTGAQGNDNSEQPTISGDGRYVAFLSDATNFFTNDVDFAPDVFLRDRQNGTTQLMSVTASGEPNAGISDRPSISRNGRYVAFELQRPVVVRDQLASGTEVACVDSAGTLTDAFCRFPSISGDGRFVTFLTRATNLVPDDTNGIEDVFVRDRELGVTQRISLTSDGHQGFKGNDRPFISADGRFVAFGSADRLVAADQNNAFDAYIHEIGTPVVAPFTLVPGAVDFARYAYGATTPARTLEVKNTGTATISIQNIRLSGQNPLQFGFASHCGASLAVGATCEIEVVFKATSVGVKTSSLDVQTNAGSLSTQLSGEGARTFFAVNPTSISFGNQPVGTRSTRHIIDVLNLGDVPLPIRSIAIGGANPGQFGFNKTCGSTVPVDDSGDGFCQIGVVFKPTSAGVKTATIRVRVAGGAKDQTIRLSGQGTP